jgi:hypothetical protein
LFVRPCQNAGKKIRVPKGKARQDVTGVLGLGGWVDVAFRAQDPGLQVQGRLFRYYLWEFEMWEKFRVDFKKKCNEEGLLVH